MARRPAIERFIEKVSPGEGDCLVWTGGLNGVGYGQFYRGKDHPGDTGKAYAHRWSYEHYVREPESPRASEHPRKPSTRRGRFRSKRQEDALPSRARIRGRQPLRSSDQRPAHLPNLRSLARAGSTKQKEGASRMDITDTLTPNSSQLNADDLVTHPVTVTIANVTKGTLEQPVNVELVEYPGRPYKPSKSMRRVLVEAWGAEAAAYIGRRLTLYRNPDIKFGADRVGGIEISHLSHLDKPKTIALTVTRGKRKPFTVQPLIESDNPQPPRGMARQTRRRRHPRRPHEAVPRRSPPLVHTRRPHRVHCTQEGTRT